MDFDGELLNKVGAGMSLVKTVDPRFYILPASVVGGFSGLDPLKACLPVSTTVIRQFIALHSMLRSPIAPHHFHQAQFSVPILSPVGIHEIYNHCNPKKQSEDAADNAGHVPRPR